MIQKEIMEVALTGPGSTRVGRAWLLMDGGKGGATAGKNGEKLSDSGGAESRGRGGLGSWSFPATLGSFGGGKESAKGAGMGLRLTARGSDAGLNQCFISRQPTLELA